MTAINYVRDLAGGGVVVPTGAAARPCDPPAPPHRVGGFALHGAFRGRVVGVSEPRVVQFPPFGCRASAVGGVVVPKAQTTSVKNAENRQLLARWSAFWAQVCLLWVAARAQTRYCEH